MVFRKQVLNSDAGSADEVGGDDWDAFDMYYDDTDVTPAVAKINTRTYYRSGKFEIRNPANDASYVFIGSALAASRNLTLPLLPSNDVIAVLDMAQIFTNKTIAAASNTITGIVDANIDAHTSSKITITAKGQLNSSIVYIDQVNTFGDFIQSFRSAKLGLSNPANDAAYIFTGAAIAANRNVTMPLLPSDDILVTEAFAQPLNNKTLDSTNTISSASSLPIVTVAKGGTGQATATLGFDALSPMTTLGDIIIGSTAGTRIRLGIGTADQVLKVNAGATAPEWGTLAVAGGGTGATTLTGVLKGNGTGAVTAAAQLAIADGGTGQASATAAFDALAPTTTAGDVIYNNGTDNIRLAIGTAGQPLKVNAGATAPEYGTLPVAGGGSGATTLTGILKGNGTGAFTALTDPLPIANGGTSGTTAATGFDALSPMTAVGDIIYGGASGTRTRLARGSARKVLGVKNDGSDIEWRSGLMPSGGRKWGTWQAAGDTATACDGLLAVNMSAVAGHTAAGTVDTTLGRARRYTTTTTITTNAGWRFTATYTTRALNPYYRALFRLGTTTLQRLYLGFHTSGVDLTGDDPLNAQAGCMLGMRSADTNFQILHNDTSGATVFDIDTGVAVDTGIHRIEIIADDANSRFGWSLDNSAFSYTNLSADIPAQTTNLTIQNEIQTNESGVAKNIELALVETEMDSKW